MKQKRMGRWCLMTAATLALVSVSLVAQGQTLRYAHGWPAQSAVGEAVEVLPELLDNYSDGRLSARVFAGSLLGMTEVPDGLRDGLADVGFVVPAFTPSSYPYVNMLTELTMLYEVFGAEDNMAAAFPGALMDFIHNDCETCRDEFHALNQVFTVSAGAPRYMLMCRDPKLTEEDLQGARIRVAGSQWTRWVEHFGGRSVAMPASELYEALGQGVVDCIITNAAELSGLALMDVVRHITMAPLGTYGGGLLANVNRDTWQALSADDRRALLRAAAMISARGTLFYVRQAEQNLETAQERGITIQEASDSLTERAHAFIREDMDRLPAQYESQYGITGGDELVERFWPYLEKWTDLVDGVDSVEALADIYWNEVLSQVDVEQP